MTSLKSQLAGARLAGHPLREPSRRRRLAAAVSGRVVSRATTAALCLAIFAMTVSACGGSGDGPASFLSADDRSAIFVQWTRTGDDVSGTLSTAEVSQAQAQTELFPTAPAPGQIQQQTGAFTGTVRDDSVRLLIGSGTQTNRVNGRLDGDTLELTIPQEQGVLTRRLKPAGDGDYTRAVQQIRDHERQRKAAAKAAQARKQRADKVEIMRVATAFQKALSPTSTDDPCWYVTSKVKVNVRGFDFGSGRPTCTRAIRDSDAELSKPVFKAPLGVAEITFGPLPPLTVSFNSGPDGAVVTWRPEPTPTASPTAADGRCSSRRTDDGSCTDAARDRRRRRHATARAVTRQPVRDAAWSARVIDAGVQLDLFESADDDYAFALLGLTITRAVSEAALCDDDAYPLHSVTSWRRSRRTGSRSTPWRCQANGTARCWRSRAMSCSSRSSVRAR